MLQYIVRRLIVALPVIFLLLTLVFFIINVLPGDAVASKLAEYGASAERLQQLREELGLTDPIHVQYARYMANALRGDFGQSWTTRQPVIARILEQLPATIQLTVASVILGLALGVPLGVFAAVRKGSWVDSLSMAVALGGVSMPNFWLGLILIFVFSVYLGVLPPAGTGGLRFLILPAIALGFSGSAAIARLTRSTVLEVLRQDYVTTARAKGLSEQRVRFHHALRNALLPVITIIGLQFGYLLGGAVIIETVFARQGVGRLTLNAIMERDVPLVQGTVLMLGLVFILTNLVVDLLYATVDPRVRYD